MAVTRAATLALCLALLLPATSGAQSCVAPPGTAAVEEYCENLPSAGGNQGAGSRPQGGQPGVGAGAPVVPVAPVPAQTVEELQGSGPDGVGLARALGVVAQQVGGKAGAGAPASRGGVGATSTRKDTVPAEGGNALQAVSRSLAQGATVGAGFVTALLVLALAFVGWAWTAYRSRS